MAISVFNTQMLPSSFFILLSPQDERASPLWAPRMGEATCTWRKWSPRKTLGLWWPVAPAPPNSSRCGSRPLSTWHCVPFPTYLYFIICMELILHIVFTEEADASRGAWYLPTRFSSPYPRIAYCPKLTPIIYKPAVSLLDPHPCCQCSHGGLSHD